MSALNGGAFCRPRLLVFVLATLLGAGWPSSAQDTAASIVGRVTDESGGVLPGVTVSASSPALQVPQVTVVTDAEGDYRIGPLPIGTYELEYSLAGFSSVRRSDLRLTAGFVARVDQAMKLGALQESVTVSGASPVVDVKAGGSTTLLTKETLELLPVARNGIVGIISQVPGVRTALDVGGSSGGVPSPSYRVFGQPGLPWPLIEGIPMATLESSGGAGSYFDQGAAEEVVVRTVGLAAENPSRGLQMDIISKSGSDEYHGSEFWSQNNQSWQSNNISDALAAQGIRGRNKLLTRYDLSTDLGGRIIPQKLWFYGSLRRKDDVSEVLGSLKPDGTQGTAKEDSWFTTEKVSFQPNSSNRFIGFYLYVRKNVVGMLSPLRAYEARQLALAPEHTFKGEWQYTRGSFVMSAQYGEWGYTSDFPYVTPNPGVSTIDIATQYVAGNYILARQVSTLRRRNPKVTALWYRPNLLGGDHEFKAGFDFMRYHASRARLNRAEGNYRLVFNNGAPFQLEAWNNPTIPMAVHRYTSAYLKDAWTVGRRLTLNLGLRYAHDNGFVPESCREAAQFAEAACYSKVQLNIWNTVSPRIHAAYDVTGNGRTVVRGGWGRFHVMRQSAPDLTSIDPQSQTTTTYRWNDRNGNRQYDAGEVDLNPNGLDFVSTVGGTTGVPNPNERQPASDEFSISLEREIMANFAVRGTGIYSRSFNNYRRTNNLRPRSAYNVPITRPDPGPDGRAGSADDPGTTITYFEYPRTLAGQRFEQFMMVNDPVADQHYTSFELAGSKRLSGGWELMASYSATKKHVPLVMDLNPSEFNPMLQAADDTPNGDIFATDNTWEWLGKVQAAYMFPKTIQVSTTWEHRSGIPWARQVLFTGGQTIPSIVLRVEEIGARRLPNSNLLSLRVEKAFRVFENHKATVRLNVYNVLNADTVTSVNMRSGATFERPLGIVPPRIAEVSATYSF